MDSRVSGSWALNSHWIPGNGTSNRSRVPTNETCTGCQVPRNGIRTGFGFLGTELAPNPGPRERNSKRTPLLSVDSIRIHFDLSGAIRHQGFKDPFSLPWFG